MTTTRLDFPVLARGAHPLAPPGILSPESPSGPLWRNLNNLRPVNGELRRREAARAKSGGLPTFLDDRDQYVHLLYDCFPNTGIPGSGERYILVTSYELFIGNYTAGWTNITPRYETGTVSITNGTATLTGSSTQWRTRRIYGGSDYGNAVELPQGSGNWYIIASVNSDTGITLTTNYTGTTLSGANYSIRRTFDLGASNSPSAWTPVFAATLNGDVYLAGKLGYGEFTSSSITVSDGAVLRITGAADPTQSAWTNASVEYLTSGRSAMVSGIDNLGYNVYSVLGLSILSAGHIVVPIHWADFAGGFGGTNRYIWCSHLNPAVWTSSPGGFNDIAEMNGSLTALSKSSQVLSFHFTDGIVSGRPTGQDDPPLSVAPTRSRIGAVGPKMIATVPGGSAVSSGDLFVGVDGHLYLFSGDVAYPISNGSDAYLQEDPWSTFDAPLDVGDLWPGWARVHTRHKTASFHYGNRELRVNYETGDVSFHAYPAEWTAGMGHPLRDGNLQAGEDVAIVGTARKDGGGTERSLLYELVDDAWADSVPGFSETTNGVFAETDAIGDLLEQHRLVDVEVWARGAVSGSQTLYLDIYRDSTLESDLTATATMVTASGAESVFRFYPEGVAANFHRLILHSPDDDTFNLRLTRMVVTLAPAGNVRAT